VRVQVFVPGASASKVAQIVNSQELAHTFDRHLEKKEVFPLEGNERSSGATERHYNKYKSPFFGVKARDFVMKVCPESFLCEEDQIELGIVDANTPPSVVFLHCGIDDREGIPEDPEYVRGAVYCYGFLAQERSNHNGSPTPGVLLTNCVAADPSGMLPAMLVNATQKEHVEKLRRIAQLAKQ
jgi:hypothetical protein